MAGSLVKIDEEIVTSPVASVTLGGADWDSSYDVYMVRHNNVKNDKTSGGYEYLCARVLTSGAAQSDANYDLAGKGLWANGAFQNNSFNNQTYWYIYGAGEFGDQAVETNNGILYLFNFNNSSEYSFMTQEIVNLNSDGQMYGNQGGGVKTTAEANNGLQFFYSGTGNIQTGSQFVLYGLKK
jgi:hypothetical protein